MNWAGILSNGHLLPMVAVGWLTTASSTLGQFVFKPNNQVEEKPGATAQQILQLFDIEPLLLKKNLLPTTVTIQRDILPRIAENGEGQPTVVRRGTTLLLHDAVPKGVIIPIAVRPNLGGLPLNQQGRLDAMAINRLANQLRPGFGIIPFDATDLVYQLREHIKEPTIVRLTEHTTTKLEREGAEVAEIELRKNREFRLVEVKDDSLRIQVHNSEADVPTEWTDYQARKAFLQELLAKL